MEQNRILQLVYTFFVGLLLAFFVGFGINTFYPAPPAPQYPVELNNYGKELTREQIEIQRKFDSKNLVYQNKMKPYNRNVSIIAMSAAFLLLALSLFFEKKLSILSDGIMLGGLFTLLYSIGRGFASEDSKYMFIMISFVLLLVLMLGYHRFVKTHVVTAGKNK